MGSPRLGFCAAAVPIRGRFVDVRTLQPSQSFFTLLRTFISLIWLVAVFVPVCSRGRQRHWNFERLKIVRAGPACHSRSLVETLEKGESRGVSRRIGPIADVIAMGNSGEVAELSFDTGSFLRGSAKRTNA